MDIITSLRVTAQADRESQWFDVVSAEQVDFVQTVIGLALPTLLRRCFMEISNGGFGPGYGLTGLPGGFESSCGNLIQTWEVFRQADDWEDGWLPIVDWGCNETTCIDCDDENAVVTLISEEIHYEDYDLEEMFTRWCAGETPDVQTGKFRNCGETPSN